MRARVLLPFVVVVVAAVSIALNFQWPLVLVFLLQMPPTWFILIIGGALTWRFEFLSAAVVCAMMTAVLFLWIPGEDSVLLLALAGFSYLLPFALLQLLFFRRGPFPSRVQPPKPVKGQST